MAQITDEYGIWEVTEGNGCINKIMVTPTQKWINENPVIQAVDPGAELVKAITAATTIAQLKEALLNAGGGIARVKAERK